MNEIDDRSDGMQLKEKVRAAMIAYRKRRSLSQQEFAERLGWTKQHVSNLETGRAGWSLEALEKVCQVFTVPVEYFLTYNDETGNYDERTGILRKVDQMSPAKRVFASEIVEQIGQVSDDNVTQIRKLWLNIYSGIHAFLKGAEPKK